MPNKTVLILAYYWPPSSGSGVQRWLKFAKYLPQFGWKPVIITPRHGTAPYYDESLINDMPPEVEVIKTDTLEPFALYNWLQGKKKNQAIPVGMMGIKESESWYQKLSTWIRGNVFVPDGRMGWYPFAAKAALQYIRHNKVDLLVTTGPPHSVHLAGLRVKEKTGIPWIADFRDPWHGIYYNASLRRTAWANKRDQQLEKKVLNSADLLTVVSEGMRVMYAGLANQTAVVLNGYDSEDMPPVFHGATEKFSLVHVGNFFPYMDVPALWETLQQLLDEEPMFREHFQLQFTGLLDSVVHQKLLALQLGPYITLTGSVNHSQATAIQTKANLLLFVIPNTKDNALVVTGKIFEYLASGSEVLSIGNVQSNVAGIIQEAGRRPMLDYSDNHAMKNQIWQAFTAWQSNQNISEKLPADVVQAYSRKATTGTMASLFSDLTLKP